METLYAEWERYLKLKGVKIPRENTWGRKVLELLYKNKKEWVFKKDIIEGIDYSGPDLQAPRHLSAAGWYIEQDYKGGYRLVSVKEAFPQWIPDKRTTNITSGSWE